MKSWGSLLNRFFLPPKPTFQATHSDGNRRARDDRYERHNPRNESIVIDLTESDNEDTNVKDAFQLGHVSTHQKSETVLQKRIDKSYTQNIVGKTIDTRQSMSVSELTRNDHGSTRNVGNYPNMTTQTKRKITEDLEPNHDKKVKKRRTSETRSTSQSIDSTTQLSASKQLHKFPVDIFSKNSTPDSLVKANTKTSRHFQSEKTRHHKATRVSIDGQVKKLSKNTARSRERLAEILEQHVFIHVRQAVRPFRDKLSREERARIGADAVRLVIEHPDFEKHFKENGNAILPSFESMLATQMCSYVNGCARHILGDEAVDRLLYYPKLSQSYSTPPQRAVLENPSLSNSDLASDQEEIFCQQQEPLERSNSFSPSTSLSIDHTEVEIERQQKDYPTDGIGPSRWPARLTRASNPLYAKPMRKKSVPICNVIIQDEVENLQIEEDVDPRPYMGYQKRDSLLVQIQTLNSNSDHSTDPFFPHVPFSEVETRHLILMVDQLVGKHPQSYPNFIENITNLMAGRAALIPKIVNSINFGMQNFASVRALRGRSRSDIEAFLLDATNDTVSDSEILPTQASDSEISECRKKINPINRMLRHREIDGIFPERIRRGLASYREIVHSSLEDSLAPRNEWADCSNDIAAITWINDNVFLLGALAHSDPHNMQYNKPGNLLLGSVNQGTVRSYPDHRIERPIISQSQNAENALESMRATQSPWLYTSVVSTAFSSISGYSFTSSYDNTTKVWRVSEDGSSMELCGTWRHEAKVNFVVTSEHHDRVATASGTGKNAVRIYHFNENAIDDSPYDEYGGNQSQENFNDPSVRRPWAYQPATIKWARAACVSNLFLVGYSPRADSGDDSDIPDDKSNTGELCVWNSLDASRLNVSSARMQNVFDVVWHPTQPVFAAATSPSGNYDGDKTKTQVRIFALKDHTFNRIMALDCPALDITELTIMPNSAIKAYITASCTDGCTYVWDMAQGEDPIHILRHGESLDNPEPNIPLELADGGVTFSAWGADVSRFYTGATDGKLIAWDVRKSPGNAFVRKVLELSGGISSGAFTKDFKKLLIGDATGKIHLLEIDDSDLKEDEGSGPQPDYLHVKDVAEKSRLSLLPTRYPKLIIPHPEPAPSEAYQRLDSKRPFKQTPDYYLTQDILRIYPGKGIFKGPNYHKLALYRAEAHENRDTRRPLIPEVMATQQFIKGSSLTQCNVLKIPRLERDFEASDFQLHTKNLELDFSFLKLTPKTKEEFRRERVELDWDDSQFLEYELTPRSTIFRIGREKRALCSMGKEVS